MACSVCNSHTETFEAEGIYYCEEHIPQGWELEEIPHNEADPNDEEDNDEEDEEDDPDLITGPCCQICCEQDQNLHEMCGKCLKVVCVSCSDWEDADTPNEMCVCLKCQKTY